MSNGNDVQEGYAKKPFPVIEFGMVKPHIFFPLSATGSFVCHCGLYPFTFIRTRLQMQDQQALYRGMVHAFRTVIAEEGFSALYRGVFVKGGQVVSSVGYIATYENVRYRLKDFQYLKLSNNHRAFIAGSCASAIAQTMVVPIDVVSQHLMVIRGDSAARSGKVQSLTPLELSDAEMKTSSSRALGVVRAIRREHGLAGFYKGYFISLCTFVPNSGLWWFFYNFYCEFFSSMYHKIMGTDPRRLPIQVFSAPLAGMSAACIINPVDITRLRMQVENQPFRSTVLHLWRTEGLAAWKKGLSARLTQSCFFSFWITLIYEPIKWYSLKDEYKGSIHL